MLEIQILEVSKNTDTRWNSLTFLELFHKILTCCSVPSVLDIFLESTIKCTYPFPVKIAPEVGTLSPKTWNCSRQCWTVPQCFWVDVWPKNLGVYPEKILTISDNGITVRSISILEQQTVNCSFTQVGLPTIYLSFSWQRANLLLVLYLTLDVVYKRSASSPRIVDIQYAETAMIAVWRMVSRHIGFFGTKKNNQPLQISRSRLLVVQDESGDYISRFFLFVSLLQSQGSWWHWNLFQGAILSL